MPRGAHLRKIKRVAFLGGEGLSEQGYGRWLNRLAHEQGIPVVVRADGLSGGDPLDLLEQLIEKTTRVIKHTQRFVATGLLLDVDLIGQNVIRDEKALQMANKNKIHLIWQRPCHEGFLLRHFSIYKTYQPSDRATADRLLQKVWPTYTKGMDANGYGSCLSYAGFRTARTVVPELEVFLGRLGWPK